MVCYHFVFCPRYRGKIFLIPRVEERFKDLVRQICMEKELDIIALECDTDHVHLFVEAWLQLSRVPSLWTRSYFVSTAAEVSSETIQRYEETQKTRYE